MTERHDTRRLSFVATLPWPAIALAAMIWLMSIAYGFQYLVMRNTARHLIYFQIATVPYVALLIGLTWFATRTSTPMVSPEQPPRELGFAMMSVSWFLTCYFYSAMIAPVPWYAAALALPALASLAMRKWNGQGANAVFMAGAYSLFVYLLVRFPHDAGGDMLQIIDFAATDLLRGANPFQPYLTVSGKEVPFGYWPGVWLPYVPLVALGIDLRVLNLLVLGLIIALFNRAGGGGVRGAVVLGVALLPILLSSSMLQMVLFGHLWLYWLIVCATLYQVVARRYLTAAALLGLCLVSRPTVLFILPPLAAYVWSRAGFATVLRSGVVALSIVVATNLPFVVIYGQDFVANSYGRLIGIGHELTHFSLTGIMQTAGLGRWAVVLQALVAGATVVVAVLRKSLLPSQFVVLCGVAYVWQVLFASYATRYVYFPGFLLIALGIAFAMAERGGDTRAAVRT